MTLDDLFEQHMGFSQATFTDCTSEDSLNHLKEEIEEVLNSECKDLEEYVDCFMCLLSSMKKAGFDTEQFKEAFQHKLVINQSRDWNKNTKGYYSHKK